MDIEDFERLNADKANFLHHLLQIGGASEELLAEATELLQSRQGPYVAALGQLPFRLQVEPQAMSVPGWRAGVSVEVRLMPAVAEFAADGRLKLRSGAPDEDSARAVTSVEFTQLIALVRLWNKRARLHSAYLNCLTPSGVRDEVIGRVEDWMNVPGAAMPVPTRQYAPLRTAAFEGEVARRIRDEVARALSSLLRAYCLGCLEDVRWDEKIYGYFAMVAPGRIANGGAPLPIAAGLARRAATPSELPAGPIQIEHLVGKVYLASEDRVLRQLIAMRDLLGRGEAELAVIGCTSTVEYFLNASLPGLLEVRGGRKQSRSLSKCASHPSLEFLSEEWREWLRELARTRNPLVHGAPPDGRQHVGRRAAVDPIYVRDSLHRALELYRLVNVHTGQSLASAPDAQARLDD